MIPIVNEKRNRHVLICPLDWGLGHASRMIPVISKCISEGHKVAIGGSGKSKELLKQTFPDLQYIAIPSINISYRGHGMWLIISLIIQLPAMIFSVWQEHLRLKKVIFRYGIDVVISDNRYGLYGRYTHNIFITHQISPVLPRFFQWAEYPLYRILLRQINRFHECWIPDYADTGNLTGKLSHRFTLPDNAQFIGILSRFSCVSKSTNNQEFEKYNLVIVLSGPQPQLDRFSHLIIRQALNLPEKVLIITGLQDILSWNDKKREGLKIVSHLPPDLFRSALLQADTIVCRSGYSTIMDLVTLGKSAVLVPTPGQTEQEYLASYLSEKGLFRVKKQTKLKLTDLI